MGQICKQVYLNQRDLLVEEDADESRPNPNLNQNTKKKAASPNLEKTRDAHLDENNINFYIAFFLKQVYNNS